MPGSIVKKALGRGEDERGVIAVLFAILILPLMTVMAIAIDLSQFLVMKQQLRSALDAAALDIAQQPTLSNAAATSEVQAFITANYPVLSVIGRLQSVTVTRATTSVVITATASMNTNFLQIIGYSTLGVTVSSQSSATLNKLEVVLVLDNTGSMSNTYGSMSGIDGLQTAATTLVNTLFASDPTLQYVKVGIVPFTATVNVGTQYAAASWLDTTGAGSLTRENLNVPVAQGLIQFATKLQNARWGGCVRQRAEPYDIQDVAPTASFPETLYTPYFAPSEPSGLYNHYLPDGSFAIGTTQAQIQYSVTKYTNGSVQNLPDYGPGFDCTVQPVIRLTNDKTAILNEINAMDAGGATVVPAGLMWGWHLLSPNGPFGDGVAYTNIQTIKAIILVTDGQNDVQLSGSTTPTNGFNKSVYSAYGYGSGPHLNILALPVSKVGVQDQSNYNIDQKEIQLCNNIKAVTDAYGNPGRIKIYAIGFGSSINSNALSLLSQCASSSSNYFYNPTSDALIATFQKIATGLNQLRISR
ncbi:MAG: TadE/TadG family type IV pilus assembly protein [Rhodomicrobium sp.]